MAMAREADPDLPIASSPTSCCSPAAWRAKTLTVTATPIRDFLPDPRASRTWTRAQAARRRDPGRREISPSSAITMWTARPARRCWCCCSASSAPGPIGLYPRPPDGGLWPVRKSAGRIEGAGRERRSCVDCGAQALRRARRGRASRARRHRRRSSPVREPASRRACDDQPNRLDESEEAPRTAISPPSAWRSCSASRCPRAAEPGLFRGTRGTQAARPARPRRARHGRRCRAAEDAQPGVRDPGPQGDGGAAEIGLSPWPKLRGW